jgi:hypothetical protein
MAFTHVGYTTAYLGTHQHDTVQEARDCEAHVDDWAWADAEAEIAAEQAAEAWFENRGDWSLWWENEQDRMRAAALGLPW